MEGMRCYCTESLLYLTLPRNDMIYQNGLAMADLEPHPAMMEENVVDIDVIARVGLARSVEVKLCRN
jgi:hypothetical protein